MVQSAGASLGRTVLLLRACAWLVSTRLALRRFGFASVSWQAAQGAVSRAGAQELVRGRRYARYLELASRNPFIRAHCLQRSLALQRWLRADGFASELRIGVRKHRGVFQAHAWIEMVGVILNDDADAVSGFATLSSAQTLSSRPAVGRALVPKRSNELEGTG